MEIKVSGFMSVYRSLLEQIQQDPLYRQNIGWGKPRRGHPEGTIGAHIAELEENLLRLQPKLTASESDLLRLMIHVHDTLKPDAKDGVAIMDPFSHASLAREFLARYCDEDDVLQMIQYHDEPYALYLQFKKRGEHDHERWERLLDRIRSWDIFVAFLIIDNCTRGKNRDPLEWVLPKVAEVKSTRWSVGDIIRFEE
jgi:hypothetical protein